MCLLDKFKNIKLNYENSKQFRDRRNSFNIRHPRILEPFLYKFSRWTAAGDGPSNLDTFIVSLEFYFLH